MHRLLLLIAALPKQVVTRATHFILLLAYVSCPPDFAYSATFPTSRNLSPSAISAIQLKEEDRTSDPTYETLRKHNISCSSMTTTGSFPSVPDRLVINSPTDFKDGEGLAVVGAGRPTRLDIPTTPVAVAICRSDCLSYYTYRVSAVDSLDGYSAASRASAVVHNASSLTPTNTNSVQVSPVQSASGYLWFRNGVLFAYSAGPAIKDFGQRFPSWFPGGIFPDAPPREPVANLLVTSILSGAGSKQLLLAAPAAVRVSTAAQVLHDDTGALQRMITSGQSVVLPQATALNITSTLFLHTNGQVLRGAANSAPPAGATVLCLVPNFAISVSGQNIKLADIALQVLDSGVRLGPPCCEGHYSFLSNTIHGLQIYGMQGEAVPNSSGIQIEGPAGATGANYFHYITDNFINGFAISLRLLGNAEYINHLTASAYSVDAVLVGGTENFIHGIFCNNSAGTSSAIARCVHLTRQALYNSVEYKLEAGPYSQGYYVESGSHGNLLVAANNGGFGSIAADDRNATIDLTASQIKAARGRFETFQAACRQVADLPKNEPAGTMICVSDWNGQVGDCVGGSSRYGIGLSTGRGWTCH